MDDLQLFNRFLEPTREQIQHTLDKLSHALLIGDPDKALVDVDDLREACFTLERSFGMINRADRLLKRMPADMR